MVQVEGRSIGTPILFLPVDPCLEVVCGAQGASVAPDS